MMVSVRQSPDSPVINKPNRELGLEGFFFRLRAIFSTPGFIVDIGL
jgi:hypothetical protein